MTEKNLIKIYVNATSAKEWTSLSDMPVSCFGNSKSVLIITAGILTGNKTEVGSKVLSRSKLGYEQGCSYAVQDIWQ